MRQAGRGARAAASDPSGTPRERSFGGSLVPAEPKLRKRQERDMAIETGHAILRDLGFALRSLRRTPGFTVIAILTLGLGIGANTSAFSVLNEAFLRPLPYADSGQLDRIYRKTAQ